MTSLPDLLDLDDGARLTGISLLPLAMQVTGASGRVVMQTAVRVSESGDVAGSAVIRFLPAAVVVINGVQPDGHDWFATFEYVSDADPGSGTDVARAGLVRALDLTGVGVGRLRTQDFAWHDLHAVYADRGIRSVTDWGILDLLLGMIIDLPLNDLAGVVERIIDDSIPADAQPAHRRSRMHAALRSWASRYEGPERQVE